MSFYAQGKVGRGRIAAVVATSLELATEAIALIRVDYEPLPILSSPEEALQDHQTVIHPGGDLIHQFENELGEREAFRNDCVLVKTVITTQKVHHAALETHVCMADYNSSGTLTIWAACQGVFGVRTIVADLLGLSYNKVRVIKLPVGGLSAENKKLLSSQSLLFWQRKSDVRLN